MAFGRPRKRASNSSLVRVSLVGVNFDRVWGNIANDFGYNPDIARNVTADVRYMLWMLEEIEGARAVRILKELGLH